MFREELERRMSGIFGLQKTTFDVPSETFEQDTLFIEVQGSPKIRASAPRIHAAVTGDVFVFSKMGALPFGFFSKRIEQASGLLLSGLYFFQVDREVLNSQARHLNLCERRASFRFLYEGDYDPKQGEMSSINLPENVQGG